MKLNNVLKLRKSEQSNEKIDLDTALKLRKAKYIKRWKGKDGFWHYRYAKDKPKELSELSKERIKKIKKTLMERGNYDISNKDILKLDKEWREIERAAGGEETKRKPKSSKEYMKEHAVGIRKEADELRGMSDKDFKRKKEEYDKKKA